VESHANALSVLVAPDPACLPVVRQQISRLGPGLERRTVEDLRLLVNELVTNSLRYARFVDGDQIEVRVQLEGDVIRVEVRDPGPGFHPGLPAEAPSRPDKWGLYLVDRLAESWGVDTDRGCRVWFVLRDISV
jgi:anti-sigma regulatory factor (Ser/Thr protein kinase)